MALDHSMERLENDRDDLLLHQMDKYKFDIPIKVTIKVEEEEEVQEYFGNPLNELEKQVESLSYSKNYFHKTNTSSSECFKNCMSDQLTSVNLLRSLTTSANFINNLDKQIENELLSNAEICFDKFTLDDVTSKDLLRSTSSNCINIFDEKIEPVTRSINYFNEINAYNNECLRNCTLDDVTSKNRTKSTPSNVNTISEMKNIFTPDKDLAMNKIQLVTLLDRLSENLIQLSKYCYEANINYKNDETVKQKYFKTKYIFFHLSYRTITAIILPQEKNQTFIHKFIKRTIAIAHTKSWYYVSEKLFLCYLNEMIHWVKERNKILENQSNQFKFSIIQDTHESLSGTPANIICIENASHRNNRQTKKKTEKKHTFVNKTKSNPNFKFANSAPKRRKTTENTFPARSIKRNLNTRRHSLQNSNIRDYLPNDNLDRQKQKEMLNANICRPVSNMSRNGGPGNSTHNLQPSIEMLSSYKNYEKPNIEENNNATTFHNTRNSNKNSVLVRPCCVCQTMTHKMCVGCYKLYYCTLTCQSMDWAVHKNSCGGFVIK